MLSLSSLKKTEHFMSAKHIILITCTIGYGHEAAAQNLTKRLKQDNPGVMVHRVDTAPFIYPLKEHSATLWNQSVRKGRFVMSFLEWAESYYESFYNIFLRWPLQKYLSNLFKLHSIDAIYDTQPLFTPIIKNVAAKYGKQDLQYHKVFTDLPTKDAQHFLSSIKKIKKNPPIDFKVHALTPALDVGETIESFWAEQARLHPSQIQSTHALPVNAQYLTKPNNPDAIDILIEKPWGEVNVEANAYVTTVMLGSQGVDAVYGYTQAYLEQVAQCQSQAPHYLFIACSRNEKLYQRINDLIEQSPCHGHKIIPLRMQTLEGIASLMWRSDRVIIRSSGLSCMEQIALRDKRETPPQLFIHSPHPKHDNANALLNATHGWEHGNAVYMIQHHQAEMTTPHGIRFFT